MPEVHHQCITLFISLDKEFHLAFLFVEKDSVSSLSIASNSGFCSIVSSSSSSLKNLHYPQVRNNLDQRKNPKLTILKKKLTWPFWLLKAVPYQMAPRPLFFACCP
mmetsp:Transcript_2390/g.3538  ORF Transcript_2390/g.3538 Transcript_2390/m.3538 type:complete len:106 (-) Transcript_2390:927-1244(-)